MSMHDAQPPYARHAAPQHDSNPWSTSTLYSSADIGPSSGSVGTACSSPDGVGDYPMAEGNQQHFFSSLHNALAPASAGANAPSATSSSAYSPLGLPNFSAASSAQRQSGAPFGGMPSLYSPSGSRSAREWPDNLIVMDDAEPDPVSAYPSYLTSSAGDLYRRAVAVKPEPEDADIGGVQQQRQRSHFVMEPQQHHQQHQHPSYAHTHSLSPGSGTSSHPHPPLSPPQAGLSSPLSPLSPTGAGTLSPSARAPATPASALADAFRGTTQSILNSSPFSAFSSAGGVAGASVFDIGSGSGAGGDMHANGFASPQPEPILPHAMTPPLRAVNASKEMRRMMGVFRLNPFTMMNGAPVPSAWDGSEAGPLESEPVQLEFRVYFEGMLIEDEEDEGAGGSGGGRAAQEDEEDANEDAYDIPGPSAASQVYTGSRRAYGHPQRDSLLTRNISPPNLDAYGLRIPGMSATTANSRTIFDRDLERQREMRAGSGSFGSPSSSSMAQYHQNNGVNTLNTSSGPFSALCRPRSALSAPVSDGLSDSSTAVCAAQDAGVSADSAFLDLDSSRPHSQGSFSSAYPAISSAFAGGPAQTLAQQTALRTQSHGLFRGSSAVPNGSGGTSLFTPTPAALAAEMHLSFRARHMYNSNRARHGSLSSNRSELSGSASPPMMHGVGAGADYHLRSPNLHHTHQPHQQHQQRTVARHAAHPYHATSAAQHAISADVALDLNVLSPTAGMGAAAGQSFIGPGQGGGARHYVSDHNNNATTYSLTSASFASGFDGTSNNHGHVSPVDHGSGMSRRWPDTSSVQRVYS